MTEQQVVLGIDVGGSHVKVLVSGETERRRAPSRGLRLTPDEMSRRGSRGCAADGNWRFDRVA